MLQRILWVALAALGGALPVVAQECPYTTIAGNAVTFRGNNEPVATAVFNSPAAIVAGKDGTLYVADTGNHRVRAISPSGIIRTVAGTGEPAFRGDGGSATSAALQSPSGVAIADDGTIYIADTANHRIRKVSPDGVISTIAGEGHARFRGDGGPATAGSLNRPTSVHLDAAGNVYILDLENRRVRRVGRDGVIKTVAGAAGLKDYDMDPCCEDDELIAADKAQFLRPTALGVGPDGTLYIQHLFGIRISGPDGILRPWINFGTTQVPITAPTPVEDLRFYNGTMHVGRDGTVLIDSTIGLLTIANGIARLLSPSLGASSFTGDPATGDIAAFDFVQAQMFRQRPDGSRLAIWRSTESADLLASIQQSTLDGRRTIATAPDGTLYIAETASGQILALEPGGILRVFAGSRAGSSTLDGVRASEARLFSPTWLAVDSKGTVFFAEPQFWRVRKIGPDGIIRSALTTAGHVLSLKLDGRDRVYVLSSGNPARVTRYENDGSNPTVLMTDNGAGYSSSSQIGLSATMAVTPDGSVYLGVPVQLPALPSSLLKVGPPAPSNREIVPMEYRFGAGGIAVGPTGETYIASGNILKRRLPDGTLVTIRNGDGQGFRGEHGLDSQPSIFLSTISDLTVDSAGTLFVADRTSIRRIVPCQPAPAPVIRGVADWASGNQALKLAPGQIFSLYGLRLGPAEGALAMPDESGHYPTELAGTKVLINGKSAVLLYVGANQVNAIVPFDLDEQASAGLQVVRNGLRSDTFGKLLGHYGPAILSIPAGGTSGWAVMINADGTINGPNSRAKAGSVVTIFASGLGRTDQAGEDGKVATTLKRPVHPVQITVGGQDAEVLYVGTSPGIVEGFMQINLRLPSGGLGSIEINPRDHVPQSNRQSFFWE